MTEVGPLPVSMQDQLKAALQQIQTLQAENLRLQGTSFGLEAALQQYMIKDLTPAAQFQRSQLASLCTRYHSSSSLQQPMFVVGADKQCHNASMGFQGSEHAAPPGEQSFELLSSHSSNDSVSFVPVITHTPPEKAPRRPDTEINFFSIQAPTEELQLAAAAAALLPTVPSPKLQPSTPVAAVVSPFAAYSHRAFSGCSSADRYRPVSNKALLSFGSSSSIGGNLLTDLPATKARLVDGTLSLLDRFGRSGSCDCDMLCHSLSSSIHASSLVDESAGCGSAVVCVVQQKGGLGGEGVSVGHKGDNF